MKSKQIITNYAVCPHCEKGTSPIDHLKDMVFTQTWWFCDDCGGRYRVFNNNGDIETEKSIGWKIDLAVILQYEDAYIVVRGMEIDDSKSKEELIQQQPFDQSHFYNEGTCPTNYLRVACLYDSLNDDDDPHGLFEYVGCELFPHDGDDCNYDWSSFLKKYMEVKK